MIMYEQSHNWNTLTRAYNSCMQSFWGISFAFFILLWEEGFSYTTTIKTKILDVTFSMKLEVLLQKNWLRCL